MSDRHDSVKRSGLRAASVLFVVGLSVMGPQSAGSASAEAGDGDTSTPTTQRREVRSQESDQPNRSRPDRAARDLTSAPESGRVTAGASAAFPIPRAASRSSEGPQVPSPADAVRPDHVIGSSRSAKSVAAPVDEVVRPVDRTVAALVPAVDGPAQASAVIALPAQAASLAPRSTRVPATEVRTGPVPGQLIASAIQRALDSVGIRLSGLPVNPISELLSGALWLVGRRGLRRRWGSLRRPESVGEVVGVVSGHRRGCGLRKDARQTR